LIADRGPHIAPGPPTTLLAAPTRKREDEVQPDDDVLAATSAGDHLVDDLLPVAAVLELDKPAGVDDREPDVLGGALVAPSVAMSMADPGFAARIGLVGALLEQHMNVCPGRSSPSMP